MKDETHNTKEALYVPPAQESQSVEEFLQRHMEWLQAHNEEFPPIRIATPYDADPDAPAVFLDGEMFKHYPAERRYVAPIKRPRGRPRKDAPLPLFIKE